MPAAYIYCRCMIMMNLQFLLIFFLLPFTTPTNHHPVFVTVTTVEHNAKEQILEVSCKLFTDDFEKTLRDTYKTHVDLLNDQQHAGMDKIVKDYIPRHLQITVDGKRQILQYVGFEKDSDGIMCYFQVNNIVNPKQFDLYNDLLYNMSDQQMGLMHILVSGKRQSAKISFPDKTATVKF